MFERFTDRARRVVVLAQDEARMLNHNYIGTEHLLLGLIHEGEGVAARVLTSMGISLEAVRSQVEEIIGQGQAAPTGHIPFTPRAKKVLELSLREGLQLGHNYIGTEHILLGLIREGDGVGAQVLVKHGADLHRVRQEVLRLLAAEGEEAPGPIIRTGPPMRVGEPVRLGPSEPSGFGEPALRALKLAAAVAGWLGHGSVQQSDLLWGLIRGADQEAAGLLGELGVDVEAARERLGRLMAAEPASEPEGERPQGQDPGEGAPGEAVPSEGTPGEANTGEADTGESASGQPS